MPWGFSLSLPTTPGGRGMICEMPNRAIIPRHAGDSRTAVELAGVAGEIATPAREAENLVLRHRVNILRRAPRRNWLSRADRLAFVWLYRLCPAIVDAVVTIKPETLIRRHRRGFKAFWRWKSRSRGGRPAIPRKS